MSKRDRPSSRKGFAALIILLAVLCIGSAELAASYFFAPEWFDAVTSPVRDAARSAVSLAHDAARSAASFCSEAVSRLAELLEERRAEEPPQEAEPPREGELQLADEPLVKVDYVFVDPAITELRPQDGKDILTGGVLEVEYFNQSEEPWASQPYGSDDIARYGCGPAAMAMVVNSMTGYETDPAQMAEWAVDNHHWAKQSGSYLSIVEDAAAAYGLEAAPLEELTPDAVQTSLLSGNLLVALMGPGHFTKGGHFIVLRGITLSGSILVADPNSTERSLMEWEAQLILDELSASRDYGAPLWAISRRQTPASP